MRVFGIDPGSERTGYGCVETDGSRHQLVACGAITARPSDDFPARLARIHEQLSALLAECRPDCVAIESLFHANNARSALKLGHARGVAMLAAVQAGCLVVEYTPAEVKRAVVGYGRAEKQQVQQMIKLLLGLTAVPTPHDASDALAVAICHVHSMPPTGRIQAGRLKPAPTRTGRLKPAPASTNDAGAGFSRPEGARRTEIAPRLGITPKTWRQYRPGH